MRLAVKPTKRDPRRKEFAAEFVETAKRSLDRAEFERLQQITQAVLTDPDVARFAKPERPLPPSDAACLELAERALADGDEAEACRAAGGGLERAGAGYMARSIGHQPEALIAALKLRLSLPRTNGEKHKPTEEQRTRESTPAVVLAGGVGTMESQYRAVVEAAGYRLVYIEKCNNFSRLPVRNLAAVLICTEIGAHNMRLFGKQLAEQHGAKLVMLRTASVSCLRAALNELKEGPR